VTRYELVGLYEWQEGKYIPKYKLICEEHPEIKPNDEVVIRGYYTFRDGTPAPFVGVETWLTWFMGWIKHADGPFTITDKNGYFELMVPKYYYNWTLLEEKLPQSREQLPYPQYWTKEGFGKGAICNCSIARNWFLIYTLHWNEGVYNDCAKLDYYRKTRLVMPYAYFEIVLHPKPVCN